MSMSQSLPIIIAIVVLLTVAVAALAFMFNSTNKKKKGPGKDLARQAKFYDFLNNNFLTRKTFRKIVEQLSSLSVYEELEIRTLAIQYYTQTMGISLMIVFVGIIVFRDVIAALLCIVFALIIFTTMVTKRVDNTHFMVLKEFSNTLSSIREAYTLLGNIPDAISEATRGKYLTNAMEKIYLILTATDAEERLEEFYRTVPFHQLQTLAGVCYLLSDAGDETDERGVSAFKSAISLLKRECDLEIRKLTKQKILFGILEWLPIAPLPFIGVLKWFFIKYMPGTAVIFNGLLGYIAQTVIIVLAIFAYWYISTTNSPFAIKRSDRGEMIDNLLKFKPFKRLVHNLLPKKTKTRERIKRDLKGALSDKDEEYIYASKVAIATVAFVFSLIALTLFTSIAKEFAYNNTRTASFLGGSNMTVEEQQRWFELDCYILAQPNPPRERDLQDLIPTYFPEITSMDLKDQCNRVMSKYDTYHNMHFHWWFVLVSYFVAFLGWHAPGLVLDVRKRLVKTEEEEDVLQLQTMLAILRYTRLETMGALYWLARQSRIYQNDIYFAYHEYPSNPELSIERLMSKSNLPAFQQICQRLLSTISMVTIKEAFEDLESERDQMLAIREMVQDQTLMKKRRLCSPISRAPLIAMVVGEVLMPIGVLAFNEVTNMLGQLGV